MEDFRNSIKHLPSSLSNLRNLRTLNSLSTLNNLNSLHSLNTLSNSHRRIPCSPWRLRQQPTRSRLRKRKSRL